MVRWSLRRDAAGFFPYNAVSPVSNYPYVFGWLNGYKIFLGPPTTQDLIRFFFLQRSPPKTVFHASPSCSRCNALLVVIRFIGCHYAALSSPRFRTGCSVYLLDCGVQHLPLICVFVPITVVMGLPLNLTGPNPQTSQAGVKKVSYLRTVAFKSLSLYGPCSIRI